MSPPAITTPWAEPAPPGAAAQKFTEHGVRFDCTGDSLIGILARPAQPSPVGLLIVVGGPQYRAGSHRQFTRLERHLADAGHAVLRFDHRSMGDSSGAARDFMEISANIDAASQALRKAVPELQSVAIWGLCDAASAALLYLDTHPQAPVAGLCLLNPWVRSAQTQAAAQVKHYYARRLTDRNFWLKLLRGQVGAGRLADFWRTMRARAPAASVAAPTLNFRHRMARAWHMTSCPLLLVLSGQDLTAKEFIEALASDPPWQGAMARPRLTRLALADADHTFSNAEARDAVARATAAWLQGLAKAPALASSNALGGR